MNNKNKFSLMKLLKGVLKEALGSDAEFDIDKFSTGQERTNQSSDYSGSKLSRNTKIDYNDSEKKGEYFRQALAQDKTRDADDIPFDFDVARDQFASKISKKDKSGSSNLDSFVQSSLDKGDLARAYKNAEKMFSAVYSHADDLESKLRTLSSHNKNLSVEFLEDLANKEADADVKSAIDYMIKKKEKGSVDTKGGIDTTVKFPKTWVGDTPKPQAEKPKEPKKREKSPDEKMFSHEEDALAWEEEFLDKLSDADFSKYNKLDKNTKEKLYIKFINKGEIPQIEEKKETKPALNQYAGKRAEQVAQGAYDGRFKNKVIPDKKKQANKNWAKK